MKRLPPSRAGATGCRGQSLVEFAFVSIGLVMLLFGVVEMCRLVLAYTTVANAAREGVRYATVHGSFNTGSVDVQGAVNGLLQAATINPADAHVDVCYTTDINSGCPGNSAPGPPGTFITVNVSYPYNPLTTYFPIQVNLTSSSKGVIAF